MVLFLIWKEALKLFIDGNFWRQVLQTFIDTSLKVVKKIWWLFGMGLVYLMTIHFFNLKSTFLEDYFIIVLGIMALIFVFYCSVYQPQQQEYLFKYQNFIINFLFFSVTFVPIKLLEDYFIYYLPYFDGFKDVVILLLIFIQHFFWVFALSQPLTFYGMGRSIKNALKLYGYTFPFWTIIKLLWIIIWHYVGTGNREISAFLFIISEWFMISLAYQLYQKFYFEVDPIRE